MGARFFKLESLQLDLMRRCHKGMDEKRMMAMAYYLKSGLGKREIYSLCKKFVGDRVSIPAMIDCDFKYYRNNYWLSFLGYELSFWTFDGRAFVRVSSVEWPEDGCDPHYTYVFDETVPFDFLRDNGFLRQTKVNVTLAEGYEKRYTAACLKILDRRRRQQLAERPNMASDMTLAMAAGE